MTAQQKAAAQDRADHIRRSAENHLVLVTEAIRCRDWETLGYASPSAWYHKVAGYQAIAPEVRERLAAVLHAEGYSLRRIAIELGVSKDTARRDLTEVSHDETPDPAPGRVTGTDGKTYPARREVAVPKPASDDVLTDDRLLQPALDLATGTFSSDGTASDGVMTAVELATEFTSHKLSTAEFRLGLLERATKSGDPAAKELAALLSQAARLDVTERLHCLAWIGVNHPDVLRAALNQQERASA